MESDLFFPITIIAIIIIIMAANPYLALSAGLALF